jgi:hypothetical protein
VKTSALKPHAEPNSEEKETELGTEYTATPADTVVTPADEGSNGLLPPREAEYSQEVVDYPAGSSSSSSSSDEEEEVMNYPSASSSEV